MLIVSSAGGTERCMLQRRCGIPMSSAGGAAVFTLEEESPDGRPMRAGSHALPAGAEELRVKWGHDSAQLHRGRIEQCQAKLRGGRSRAARSTCGRFWRCASSEPTRRNKLGSRALPAGAEELQVRKDESPDGRPKVVSGN